jgi:hypothetical protein
MTEALRHRVGGPVDDLCRACKALRRHTVMVVDGAGRALRVMCDYCRSEHNYRGGGGGESNGPRRATPEAPRLTPRMGGAPAGEQPRTAPGGPPLVDPRERTGPAMSVETSDGEDIELLLRRVIRQELGLTPVVPADKWRGGELVLRPGKPGLQEKSWPIETFFHKIVMIRNRLRTLEQQVNAAELPEDAKLRLQAYISGCYGSLTSFNLLFADEADQFKGGGGE